MESEYKNKTLIKAKKVKNDEFYTLLIDIEQELEHYKKHFKGKVVYCNCDNPKTSNFVKYFLQNFKLLGLKSLIVSCYQSKEISCGMWFRYDGDKEPDIENIDITYFKDDGDFRSFECIELLKQSDVVVTNPPFSLFKEFIDTVINYNKDFLVIGNLNAVSYKKIFNLIINNKIWLGYNFGGGKAFFETPDNGKKLIKCVWFTTLDFEKNNRGIIFYKKYSEKEYVKYDNYDAINVDKIKDIPSDYYGVMGVPITFFLKYDKTQFEILNFSLGNDQKYLSINGRKTYTRILIRRVK